jgi:hypothetical protein
MRKMLVAASFLLMGCGDLTVGESGLVVVATPTPENIKAGSSMTIGIQVTNTTAEPVDLAISQCVPLFEILDWQGRVVGPMESRICTLDIKPPVRVEPNTSVDAQDLWTGESRETQPTGDPIYLPPGTYLLRPRVMVVGGEYVYGKVVAVTILTP